MATLAVEGAVPFADDRLSQLPPSDVLTEPAQVSVPLPALRICNGCAGDWGVLPLTRSIEKLSCPGRLSKNVAEEGSMVRVTGTVIVWVPSDDWKMISSV